ncbi:restriction endonuclease subunit S [Streptomyces chartreusis]|uniref:restriction endonuclease subunit S n=1 Tax=Streptomyces chartreusis TaxID=1969 RepID=UPI0036BC3E63
MAEWLTLSLPEVLEFQEGPGILAKDFRDRGTPLIRLAGLKRDATLLAGCNFLDPEMVERRWSHFRLDEGDVLLSTSASLGEVATVDKSAAGAVAYTGIIRFRPADDRVIPDFISCMLRSASFKQQIEAMGVGSVMKHFGPSHLRQMFVDVPPRGVQREIAQVLAALDDKISVNDHIAKSAFDLARVLYGEASLRDGENVELGEVVGLKYGKALREPDRRPGMVPVYGCTGQVGWHDSTLTAGAGPVVGRKGANAGWISWASRPCWVIDTAFFVEVRRDYLSPEMAFLMLESAKLPRLVGDSAVPGLNREAAHRHSVKVPSQLAAQELLGRVRPLMGRATQAQDESRTLATLRDTLLPQLMSGKLRVRDAEKIVEDAV